MVDFNINGCLGCTACFTEKERPNCIQQDDAQGIFDRMLAADLLVYASPLYAYSFPAQMKSLIDRHFCFVTNPGLPSQSSVVEGKRVVLLVTCSRPQENNSDLVQTSFDRLFAELKCSIVGKYILANSSAPNFTRNAEEIMKRMASEISAS